MNREIREYKDVVERTTMLSVGGEEIKAGPCDVEDDYCRGTKDNKNDGTIKTEDIIEALNNGKNTKESETTKRTKIKIIRAFAEESDLWKYSKKQLTGKRGKDLILSFISKRPLASWRSDLAILKLVWMNCLNLDWPMAVDGTIGMQNSKKILNGSIGIDGKYIISKDNIINEDQESLGYGEGTLHIPSVKEDKRNEPEEANNHLGTARTSQTFDIGGGEGGGRGLKVEKIIERFNEIKEQELKPTTRDIYIWAFWKFAKFINLEKKSRRDLKEKGRKYILDFLRKEVPKRSWKRTKATLLTFWEDVLDLDFPLRKSDLKNIPKVRRGETPPDAIVNEWVEVMERERDPYLRLLFLLIAQHGWRPSHIGGIRWKHIRRDGNGAPISIVAQPENEEFKTDRPVATHVFPDVRKAILDWEQEIQGMNVRVLSKGFILPWRTREKIPRIIWDRPLKGHQCYKIWRDLQRRYKLPNLTPTDCRHWVATACRKAGLSRASSAYLMGHDSSGGPTMRDWYDHIGAEDAIAEQAEIIPDGPLVILRGPTVEIVGELPKDAQVLVKEYLNGNLGSIELANKMEELKRKIDTLYVPEP